MSKPRAKRVERKDLSLDQRRCWDALACAVGGAHHFGGPVYECWRGIRTTIYGAAATFDGSLMTRMVVVAHRERVRIAVSSGGPNRLQVTAHPRNSDGGMFERHDGIKELVALCETLSKWDDWTDKEASE